MENRNTILVLRCFHSNYSDNSFTPTNAGILSKGLLIMVFSWTDKLEHNHFNYLRRQKFLHANFNRYHFLKVKDAGFSECIQIIRKLIDINI
ncbi:hypothetical protein M5K25_005582 [Dendrobium thyrsiflorum]|uniref:LAGLIDADG homing endonuclease n=1 Tax=Dendrobium thyrsiflorum TaxID=117978 RepID=A0ABD0VJC3_DENTH